MRRMFNLLGVLTVFLALALSGCGGGGGGSNVAPVVNATAVTDGVAVDPYIVGAKFNEVDAAGAILQTSDASDANGKFHFSNPLAKDNTVVMVQGEQGLHAGHPFSGKLKRKIDIASGPLVVNPLTTLLAEGKTEEEVVAMVRNITGNTAFTAADLTADPMAAIQPGKITPAARSLLAANMAANTALTVIGNAKDLYKIQDVALAVSDKLSDLRLIGGLSDASTSAEIAAAINTCASVLSYLADTIKTTNPAGDTNVATVMANLPKEYIATVAELVKEDTAKSVVIDNVYTPPVQVADLTDLAKKYYDAGISALATASTSANTADFELAIAKFGAAASLTENITDSALKDKVLFFGAFAKIAALADPISDGVANGLNNIGDILDAFGLVGSPFAKDRSNLNHINLDTCTAVTTMSSGAGNYPPWQECDLALNANSPTSGDMQAFFYNNVGTKLVEAIAMLEKVSPGFAETVSDGKYTTIEFDATDAKFITAMANGVLAQINLFQVYNLDLDLAKEQAKSKLAERTDDQVLADNPNLGKLNTKRDGGVHLADVKRYANAAIAALEATAVSLSAESTSSQNQVNDFVKIDDTTCTWSSIAGYICTTEYNNATKIAALQADLLKAKDAMSGKTIDIVDSDGQISILDVSKFFAAVDLRAKLPKTLNAGAFGNKPSLLPDPTFDGVLVKFHDKFPQEFNVDLDEDGALDAFGYTYFMNSFLAGRTWEMFPGQLRIAFDLTGNTFTALQYYPYDMRWMPFSGGTYSIDNNVTTLDFSSPMGGPTRAVATLVEDYTNADPTWGHGRVDMYSGTQLIQSRVDWWQQIRQTPLQPY